MNDLFSLGGMHVLVTGGSSGLGLHFATMLAGHGAKVTLAARRAEAVTQGVADIKAGDGDAQSATMDVTDAASIEGALDKAEAGFGQIDVVINNAGVTATKSALDQDQRTWDFIIDTNLKGVWLTAQATARRMVARKSKGSIINIVSILGLRVAGALAPYAVSKAGVVQMTKALALECAHYGVRVNALAPGYFKTELNDDFFAGDAGKALFKRVPRAGLAK